MPADTLADARGLLALAALLLLPGWLVVRAPWPAVPFLSLSFWVTSWWWLALAGAGRRRFLGAALLAFALLATLRLLRSRFAVPAAAAGLVLAAALLRLLPFAWWPAGPGDEASFHGLATLLMVVRDGVPDSYEPLLPVRGFGGYPPGLHAFAADVALLAGIPPYRAAWLASLAAQGVLQIALFALLGRFSSRSPAAIAAVLALAASRLPSALGPWGGGSAVLAVAFVVAAAALLVRGEGRPAAAAAGAFLGAAFVGQSLLGLTGALVLGAAASRAPGGRARLALAGGVALTASAPFLIRLDLALSAGERAQWLEEVGVPGLLASAFALLVVVGVCLLAGRVLASPRPAARLVLALLVVAALEGLRRDLSVRPESPLGPDDLGAMAWIAAHARPLDVVCHEARTAAVWIPAVAGRAISAPVVPALFRDELRGAGERPCAYGYWTRGGPGEPAHSSGVVVFQNATVAVTSFDSPGGNPGGAGPVGSVRLGGGVGSRWGDGAPASLHCPRSGS